MAGNGQFTKGPVAIYVVIPQFSVSQAYFMGTSVTSPKERAEQYEIPVYNDLGGRSARFQSINDGEEWRIPLTMNRFDLNICRSIRYLKSGIAFSGSFPNPLAFPANASPPLGTQTNLARGTFIMGVQDFQLWLVNTYAGTLAAGLPTAAAVDLNAVRGYASCSMTAYEEDQETTRVTEISMMIEARGLFNPQITSATIGGQFTTPARGFVNYYEGSVPTTLNFNPVN